MKTSSLTTILLLFWGIIGYSQNQETAANLSKAGSGVISFDGYEPLKDKPVNIWYYTPVDNPVDLPILFVCHGVKRNADDYRDNWIALANQYKILIVAPEFSKEHYPRSLGYNLGNMFDEAGKPLPEEVWSFSIIDPIFDFVVRQIGGRQTAYDMFGHSAGAQFAHRFVTFKHGTKANRVVSANAGWYTMPDFSTDYPYGLGGTQLSLQDIDGVLQSKVVVLLGDQDTERGKYLRKTPEADAQGNNRYERGQAYFEWARQLSKDRGIKLGWIQQTVPGVGHDNAKMAPAAAEWLYRQEP
jgi:hypothetical protein